MTRAKGDKRRNEKDKAAFLVKTAVADPLAGSFSFLRQKTMYGGKLIAVGDTVFIFASETDGGAGLIARGVVTHVASVPKRAGLSRQTPRVSIEVRRTARAKRKLSRDMLKGFIAWGDGQPETELNFKFYRQATNKIGGVSPAAAAFLQTFF